MFDTAAGKDERSRQMTRRVFLGGAAAVIAGGAVLKIYEAPGVEASTAVHGQPGMVSIVLFDEKGARLRVESVPKVVKTDGEWFRQLGKNSYGIAREADTEMPYSGVSWKEHRPGIYRCIGCTTALFSSATKFESGTGWPSFWDVLTPENVVKKTDSSLGMARTEVKCARCDGHLGHVFDDGPEPTGMRYCMNSAAMKFVVG